MRFMVIEHFSDGKAKAVYQRFRDKGRLMPEGVSYVDSWVEANFERCFQLVECEDVDLLETWADNWRDLVAFEFYPVVSSAEAAEATLGESPDTH
jgi:hypothetical protein